MRPWQLCSLFLSCIVLSPIGVSSETLDNEVRSDLVAIAPKSQVTLPSQSYFVPSESELAQKKLSRQLKSLIQYPAKCWDQSHFPCGIQTPKGGRWDIQFQDVDLVLDEMTTVWLQKEDQRTVTLVEGVLWVAAKNSSLIKTRYGAIQAKDGECWIVQSPGALRTLVRATTKGIFLLPNGASESIHLPAGMENWIGPVDRKGRGSSGVPMALNWTEHIEYWAGLTDKNYNQFKAQALNLYLEWEKATKFSVVLHRNLAQRYIASEKERLSRVALAKQRAEEERREILKEFRQRNFIAEP